MPANSNKGWTDKVIGTITKNARSDAHKAMSASLKTASRLTENWTWIDFCDPHLRQPCLALEWLFGSRGLLCGRMMKMEALEGVGKSSLCYMFHGMAQQQGCFCWHGESEDAASPPDYIAKFGCNPTELLLQQPGSLERSFEAMEMVIKNIRTDIDPAGDHPILASMDSISGFGSDAQMDDAGNNPDGNAGLGAHARAVSRWFRDRGYILEKQRVVLLATTQLKEKINTAGFTPQTGAGSRSGTTIAANPLNYHATWRLRMSATRLRDSNSAVDIGEKLTLLTTKNKLSPRERALTIDHYREAGFDMMSATCDLLRELSPIILPDASVFEIKQAGAYVKSPTLLGGKNVHSNRAGKQELVEDLYKNEALLMQIREALRIRGFGFAFETQYNVAEVADG